MQRKPLVELDAEQNIVQYTEQKQVVDIRVSDGRVEYLKDDSWHSIPLREAPEYELDIAYQSLEDDYLMLQKVVSEAYDREKEMWEVEYTTDIDGVMKSLYIRLDSPTILPYTISTMRTVILSILSEQCLATRLSLRRKTCTQTVLITRLYILM